MNYLFLSCFLFLHPVFKSGSESHRSYEEIAQIANLLVVLEHKLDFCGGLLSDRPLPLRLEGGQCFGP